MLGQIIFSSHFEIAYNSQSVHSKVSKVIIKLILKPLFVGISKVEI